MPQNVKSYLALGLILLFSMNIMPLRAADHGEGATKPFDIKEMIFSHVLDAYDWHLFTLNGHHYAIPLPVVVKGERGWEVFSSAKVSHGQVYNGYYIAQEAPYKGKIVTKNKEGAVVRPLDFSLTKNAASILLSSLLLVVIMLNIASKYKKDPLRSMKGFRGAVEQLTMSIYEDVVKPSIPNDYKRFAPYLLTVFYFIFLNNLLGLVPVFPGGANVTGNIAVTLVLALLTFVMTNAFGSRAHWREVIWPHVPVFLKTPVFPLMQFIEFIGLLTKPFALMIRLFANILAGHMIVLVLMGLIFIFAEQVGNGAAAGVTVVSVAFSVFMIMLDVLVAFIQAYVFTILSSIFIGMARSSHH